MCQVSSQSIAILYPEKKYDRGKFTPTPRQRFPCQNTSAGIRLIELTKSSDTLNYMPFLSTAFIKLFYAYFYCLYLCGTKSFVLKTVPYFTFFLFGLIWHSVCSIKGSAILVLLVQTYRESEIRYLQQI